MEEEERRKKGRLYRFSNSIIATLETLFFKLGRFVGEYPWLTICLSSLTALCCSLGMFKLETENRMEKLWVPYGSPVLNHIEVAKEMFPLGYRYESILLETDNILTPGGLQMMLKLDQKIKNIKVGDEDWNSICYRHGECFSKNLLELWGFKAAIINNVSQDDILNKVNEDNLISPVFLTPINIISMLGGITRDSNNRIIGSKASLMTYLIKSQPIYDKYKGIQVDKFGEQWDLQFLEIANMANNDELTVYKMAHRSIRDETNELLVSDMKLLVAGYGIVVIYVMIFISRLTLIEHKVYITLAGILTVGMSVLSAMGLSIFLGQQYGPLQSVIPFLLLGLGFDDMFVLVTAWYNLSKEDQKLEIKEQVAISLKHSGVSITVTSITDFFAFLVGSTTILPGLRSFCVYCAIGILFLFIFSITFFLSCLVIDRQRYASRRDACICCYKHKEDYQPAVCGQRNYLQDFFYQWYAPVLLKPPVKVLVLVVTFASLGVCMWGVVTWEQDYNQRLFFPSNGNVNMFYAANDKYFPSNGRPTVVYVTDVDYYKERKAFNKLYDDMINNKWIRVGSVSSWYHTYQVWMNETKSGDLSFNSAYWPANETVFFAWLNEFLNGRGVRFAKDIKFNPNLTSIKKIIGSRITAHHITLRNSADEILAMDSVQSIVKHAGFQSKAAAFAFESYYLQYEANKVIQEELLRNLILASVCVFVVVFLLLANFVQTFLVFCCVIFTLVDLAGTLKFWGLTIDICVCIQLIISIGLAVDSSVHIAHTFMVFSGTKNERAKATLAFMGPAVLSGGLSTFLAVVVLSGSNSYVFTTFFKVFLLVVVYSLFHGLVFLPVLQDLIGPKSYLSAIPVSNTSIRTISRTHSVLADDIPESRTHETESNSVYKPTSDGDGNSGPTVILHKFRNVGKCYQLYQLPKGDIGPIEMES